MNATAEAFEVPEANPSDSGAFDRLRSSELTSFFGRRREIAALRSFIDSGVSILTITGPGGVGKTRLVLALQDELREAEDFPGGVHFIALASILDFTLVVPTIARSFGILAEDDSTLTERLIGLLKSERTLLILDNLEHLLEASLDIARLHQACPELTLIVTSRRAMRLVGEQEFPLAPLPVEEYDSSSSITELERSPAVALFLARASAQNPRFALRETNAKAVVEICSRLDGLPLAIELAAARTKLMSPQAILGRLSGRFELLTTGPRDVHKRQQTLRDTVNWSYDLLRSEEQTLFRRIAIFSGGATFEAIEAIVQQSESMNSTDLFDLVSSLVDHSLVLQEASVGSAPRFRMLETIREFGQDRLKELGEIDDIRDTHAAYFTEFVIEAAKANYGPHESEQVARIGYDLDNVRSALTWLLQDEPIDSPRAKLGLRLAGSMVRFWDVRGYLLEEIRWLTRALSHSSDTPTSERSTALSALGVNAWFVGEIESAETFQREALASWRSLEDDANVVSSLWFLGLIAEQRRDRSQLLALAEEAAALTPRFGVTLWQAVPVSLLALAALVDGDAENSEAYLRQSLAYHHEHGFRWPHAWVLGVTAQAVELRGDSARALALYQQGLSEFHQHGDVYGVLEGILAVAKYSLESGQPEIAARLTSFVARNREIIGHRVTWLQKLNEDELAAKARDLLTEQHYEAERIHGRAFRLDDAVLLALSVAMKRPATERVESRAIAESGLSPREIEVLRLLVDGRSNDEIGRALFISPRTAGTHVANILGKLGVHSRAAAVALAVRTGVIT